MEENEVRGSRQAARHGVLLSLPAIRAQECVLRRAQSWPHVRRNIPRQTSASLVFRLPLAQRDLGPYTPCFQQALRHGGRRLRSGSDACAGEEQDIEIRF